MQGDLPLLARYHVIGRQNLQADQLIESRFQRLQQPGKVFR